MTRQNEAPDPQVQGGKDLRVRRWAKGLGAVAVATVIVAGSVMVGAAAGQSWHGRRGGFGHGGGMLSLPFMATALNLTQAQQDQAKAIMSNHRAEFQQLRQRSRTARQAVRQAVQADPVNEQAIRAAVSQASQVEADGAVLRANVRQEMLALLSAEQRAKFDQMKQSFRERAQKRAEEWRNNRAKPQQPSQPAQPQQ